MNAPAVAVPVVYGVGSGGSKLAATIVRGAGPGGRRISQKIPNVEPVCISSSRADIERLRPFVDKHLYLIGDGSGSGMNPEKGRKDYLGSPYREEIVELPAKIAEQKHERIDLIPVIFTAGFGCGSGAGPQLIADLVEKYPNTCVLGVCTFPFSWEGVETYKRAVQAFETASKHAPVIPASNSYLISSVSADFVQAINIVNEKIVRPLSTIIRVMSSDKSITDIDSSDLRRILKAAVLVMQYRLPSPAEIPNLRNHDSSTLVEVHKGFGKISCIAAVEAGRGQLLPEYLQTLPDQLSQILGADIAELKSIITKRPDAEKTSITFLMSGLKLYR